METVRTTTQVLTSRTQGVQEHIDEILMGKDDVRVPQTKIICTLGPESRSVEVLEDLLKAGMSVARFNFSHGSHEYHQETLDNLHKAMVNTRRMCAVMLDTKGPEIRTGFLKDGKPVNLVKGQEVTVTTDYEFKGDSTTIALSYKSLPRDVKPGSSILIADGSIVLEVLSCDMDAGTVRCVCTNSAKLGERKNCNLPGVNVDLPTLTEKDLHDIIGWGVPNDIDFIAASFVRKAEDLDNIRSEICEATGKPTDIKIISKIENQEGLINFDEILERTDAIMVARGDLGMEIPTEQICVAQKLMIQKCNKIGKPVVTATQMLESMVKNPSPTRAEATDVANAVIDGTDCVMLSGETAAGSFPVRAVSVMRRICCEAESYLDYYGLFKAIMKNSPVPMAPLESLASTAVRTAHKVNAEMIIVITKEGTTARLVSKYRPSIPILAVAVPVLSTNNLAWVCSSEKPARQTLLTRGIIPMLAEASAANDPSDSSDEMVDILSTAINQAKLQGYCTPGGTVVAMHKVGPASLIKIVNVH
ncbi:pyruvate kinase [Chloropicon primus]|uniref:Pyruvate kinase n=1 Tax=Chloropicon primus TaxID=1764295 RepID=A0A5B8MQS2_9CHLO|nr:pyruvate kinase [Chloropicon primus]|eukprot:QDZ22737.1 pyruvate kinase [Chloropicon primus]